MRKFQPDILINFSLIKKVCNGSEIRIEAEAHRMENRKSGSCLLQLIKIHADNDNYTLLDGGATLSLITFHKADELGLQGKNVRLAITKVGGETERIDSYKFKF